MDSLTLTVIVFAIIFAGRGDRLGTAARLAGELYDGGPTGILPAPSSGW